MPSPIMERYQRAKSHKDLFIPYFEECYEYAMPGRESFYGGDEGQRRDDKIFDETAVVGVQEFASRLQHGVVPNYSRWSDLKGGVEIPEDQRDAVEDDLDEVTEYVFGIIHASNFAQEVHESFLDLAVGTGTLQVDEGDAINPIKCRAVGLPHIVIEEAHDGSVGGLFRLRKAMTVESAMRLFPDAVIQARTGENKVKLLELVERDFSKKNEMSYKFTVLDVEKDEVVWEDEFTEIGSNPYIVFRWTTAPGEAYGRGPLFNALAAIKTANLTVELVLENAQMSIGGIWQMEDDGVVNPDTISLMPNTIIPIAPGSRGLEGVGSPSNFDVSQLILQDMRLNIKRALYNDMLGDPDKTPASATEVAERMADLSRRMGAAFGRLQTELVQPFIQRVIYILKKQGRIEIPVVNGREVRVVSTSPLAQAQKNEDIASVARFLEMVAGLFGPELLNILVSSEEVAVHLGKQFGVPDKLIRNEDERKQIIEAITQMAAAQQAQGVPNDQTEGGPNQAGP